MGTWGTGISSNDTYGDIYGQFFDLYNDGKNVPEITEIILNQNAELLEIPEDVNNLWFAIAKSQWECKHLQPAIYERVKEIIESGRDLDVWVDLGATKQDIYKRKGVLEKLLLQLQSERPNARRRKKKKEIIREPIFGKGDCFTYRLSNGNFGGAVVLEAEYGTELGLNLVAVTRINQKTKPTEADFKKANVLVMNFASWEDKPQVIWTYGDRPNDLPASVEVVAKIKVNQHFLAAETRYKYSFTGNWEYTLIKAIEMQFESEKTKPKPELEVTIRGLTRAPSFWRTFC